MKALICCMIFAALYGRLFGNMPKVVTGGGPTLICEAGNDIQFYLLDSVNMSVIAHGYAGGNDYNSAGPLASFLDSGSVPYRWVEIFASDNTSGGSCWARVYVSDLTEIQIYDATYYDNYTNTWVYGPMSISTVEADRSEAMFWYGFLIYAGLWGATVIMKAVRAGVNQSVG